jgi:hypothetical protein
MKWAVSRQLGDQRRVMEIRSAPDHITFNQRVAGSSPATPTNKIKHLPEL